MTRPAFSATQQSNRHNFDLTVSILTAVLPARGQYMAETDRSVADVKKEASKAGWFVDWTVVIDGPGDIPALAAADSVLRLPERRGVSTARNLALGRASGDWIVPLDADDLLVADGFVEILSALPGDKDVGWLAANRVLMDGSRTPHWNPAPRRFEIGRLAECWTSPFPFHPNSIAMRTQLALALGGWPALPSNEDLGLVLLASEAARGFAVPGILTKYRAWSGQEVGTATYAAEKPLSLPVIASMVNAVRQANNRPQVSAPPAGPAYGIVAVGASH
jgi:hypothetical protein